MPNITPNPVTVTPPKTSGGSLKNPANLIAYSAAAQGPQAELWANVHKALRDAQSQLDGIANSLRAPLGIPDPIQVVDAQGNLVANIGTYVSPFTNSSFSGIWAKTAAFATEFDPTSNGAIGDGVADDTNALQTTINNSGGSLYLRPGKTFICSSTLTINTNVNVTTGVFVIYGGGRIFSSATPSLSIAGVNTGTLIMNGIIFVSTVTNGVCLSFGSSYAGRIMIGDCFFNNTSTGGTGISITTTNNIIEISRCGFNSSLATGIALTSQLDMNVAASTFLTGGSIVPVTTSGTCTYNLSGCNVAPHYGNPVLKQYAEFTGVTQTITAGAGFTAVTSCSFTISATGTWQISANVLVQQAAAATNFTTIRFARNGTGDTHDVASGAPANGEFALHLDLQIALTSGDTIALQCSASGANASLLGTGNTGTTNISGVFLTT